MERKYGSISHSALAPLQNICNDATFGSERSCAMKCAHVTLKLMSACHQTYGSDRLTRATLGLFTHVSQHRHSGLVICMCSVTWVISSHF
jgi:hypothetical protein